jgi:hypothetical protein
MRVGSSHKLSTRLVSDNMLAVRIYHDGGSKQPGETWESAEINGPQASKPIHHSYFLFTHGCI